MTHGFLHPASFLIDFIRMLPFLMLVLVLGVAAVTTVKTVQTYHEVKNGKADQTESPAGKTDRQETGALSDEGAKDADMQNTTTAGETKQ